MKTLSKIIVRLLLLAGVIFHPVIMSAQTTEYWDELGLDASPGGGGTGNWNAADWYISGGSDSTWTSGGIAYFGGTAGTVTLNASETADGITFATSGYFLSQSSTFTLTLAGTTPTITVPSSDANTVACNIGGSAGVTISASGGTLVMAGTNSYTGGTTLSSGTLILSNTANCASTSGTVAVGGNTLIIDTTLNSSVSISGTTAAALTENLNSGNSLIGPMVNYLGTVTVNDASAGSGQMVINAGGSTLNFKALIIGAGGTVDIATPNTTNNSPVTLNGGVSYQNVTTNTGSGNLRLDACTQTGNILLNASSTISSGNATASKITGIISDGGGGYGITKNAQAASGAGTTIALSGLNTYGGVTTIQGGNLQANSVETAGVSGPFGAPQTPVNSIVLSGGFLQYSSANHFDYSSRISSASTSYNIDVNGQNVTFASALGGGATLTNSSTTAGGSLILTAANNYSGNTTINSGATLILGGAGSLGGGNYSGNIVINDAFVYNSSTAQTLSGVLSGSGGTLATQSGAGTLTLYGNNTYTGGTTIGGGFVAAAVSGAIPTGSIVVNAGTLDGQVAGAIAGNVTVNNGGVLELDNSAAMSVSSSLSLATSPSAGTVNLNFTGTQTLVGLSFGGTAMPNGTYGAMGNAGATYQYAAFSGSGVLNVTSGAYWDPNNTGGTGSGGTGTWSSGTPWFNSSADVAWVPNYTATFAGSAGTVSLGANETADALIFTTPGYTVVSNSGSPNALTLAGVATISVPATGTETINATITGSSGLTVNSAGGTLVLAGASTYTGGTTIKSGTLQLINSSAAASTSGTLSVGSNALIVNESLNQSVALTSAAAGTLTENLNVGNSLIGSMTGFLGTVYVNDASPASGQFVVNSGGPTLNATAWIIGYGATIDISTPNTTNNGQVTLNGGPTYETISGNLRLDACTQVGNVLLNAYSTIGNGNASSSKITGVISDGGRGIGFTKIGSGPLVMASPSTYSGSTTLSQGILQVAYAETPGTSGPLGASPAVNPGSIVLSGGTFQYSSSNNNDYSGRFSTAVDQGYFIDLNGQNVTFANGLNSSGGVLAVISSTTGGTLTLSGTNTFTGNTQINSGSTLAMGGAGKLGGGNYAGDIFLTGSLDYNSSAAQTLSGVVSGTGALTQNGPGTLTLSGANSYSGGTTNNGGILAGSAAGAIPGLVTVLGGTVDGHAAGSILGSVTVSNSGTLELDNSSAMYPYATISLGGSSGTEGVVNLNFAGTQTISALSIAGVSQAPGTYGASGSGAANQLACFSGTGTLTVSAPAAPSAYWDAAGLKASPGGGGTGSWDSSTADWWVSGGSDQIWPGNYIAFFEGTAGTVTLNASESPYGLTFATAGYSIIEGSSIPNLTLLGATPTIIVPSGTTTINATLAGSGLTETGPGTLVLTGTNTSYTGGMTITPGSTIELNNAAASGAGTIVDNGTLAVNIGAGTLTTEISGPGIINLIETSGDSLTLDDLLTNFTGTIDCPASPGGAAKCVLGNSTLSDLAVINVASGGTLFFAAETNAATVILNGNGNSEGFGALRVDSGEQSGPVILKGNSSIGNDGSSTSVIVGPISQSGGAFSLFKTGQNTTIVLTGANSYTGPTVITNGTLAIGGSGSLGGGNYAATITINAGTFEYNSTATQTISGYISSGSGGALVQAGPGTLILSALNTYEDGTTLSGGILQAAGPDTGASGPLGNAGSTILFTGGTLQYSSANNHDYSSRFNAASTAFNLDVNGQAVTLASSFSGGGGASLTVSSTVPGGTLTLTASDPYNGPTVINSGTLALGTNGSIPSSPSVAIAAGATFDVSGADPYFWGSSAALVASGAGTGRGTTAAVLNDSGSSGAMITLQNGPVNLTFTPVSIHGDTTHPALYIPNGTLTFEGDAITVTNDSSPLEAGTYTLISGSVVSNGASTVTVTGNGLAAGATASLAFTPSAVNLVVTSTVVPTPGINSFKAVGGNFVFSGTNGPANGSYVVLMTTNVALPFTSWTPIATNTFSGTGTFGVTNAIAGSKAFFAIQVP